LQGTGLVATHGRRAQSLNRICQVALVCTIIKYTIPWPILYSPPQTAAQSIRQFLQGRYRILLINLRYIARFAPPHVLLPVAVPGPRLKHDTLEPNEPISQTASRSLQPFFHNTRSLPTDRQTDRPITEVGQYQQPAMPARRDTMRQLQFVTLQRLKSMSRLQCFDAVGWAAGRASGL